MIGLRRAVWIAGAPARTVLLGLIKVYQWTLSGILGGQCRFYPSCSHYAEDAIRVHGATRGVVLSTWRVLRCSPLTAGGVEHVPARRSPHPGGPQYDSVIPVTGGGAC